MTLAELREYLNRCYGFDANRVTGTDAASLDRLSKSLRGDGDSAVQRRAISSIAPAGVDPDSRSAETVIATEEPVRMLDLDRWEIVDEILLMDGLDFDAIRKGADGKPKLPLLDAHQRDSTARVKGSVIDLRTEGGRFLGREVFSSLAEAEFVKTAEGHLDQRSAGYRVAAVVYVEPGEEKTVNGRTFAAAPNRALRLATRWVPLEESIVPIGADPSAGVRAAIHSVESPITEVETMDPKIREMLIKRGLIAETATEDEAKRALAEFLAQDDGGGGGRNDAAPQPQGAEASRSAPDTSADPQEAVRAERERVTEIRRMFSPYAAVAGCDAESTRCQDEGVSVDEARKALLAVLQRQHASVVGQRVTVLADEADNRRENMGLAIQLRCGHRLEGESRTRAMEFGNLSLFDMARQDLELHGVGTRGLSRMEIVGRAFTNMTGDFPYILENTARNTLMSAYSLAPQPWAKWCARGSLSDFKTARRSRLSEAGVLDSVPEGGEFPEHTMTEARESIQLGTFGKIFSITRQAVINDDLDAFARIPTMHARAWARTINQTAVKVLLTNAAMTDGTELFAAGHSNLDATTTTVTTAATAAAVIRALAKLMASQKDDAAESYLQIQPAVVLTGATLAPWYVQAVYEIGRADNNRTVDIARMGLEVVQELEIENSALTGYGVNITYLVANPLDAPAIEVAFLDGSDAPRLEQETGFTVDGVKFKVAGDCAAAAVDYKGIAKHVK